MLVRVMQASNTVAQRPRPQFRLGAEGARPKRPPLTPAQQQIWDAMWMFKHGDNIYSSGNPRLMETVGVSEKTVCDAMKRLAALGHIESLGRAFGGSKRWKVSRPQY